MIGKTILKIRRRITRLRDRYMISHAGKVFCIGLNKTGTTSMASLLMQAGYKLAPQRPAEYLVFDWAEKKHDRIIEFARYGGTAFQDVPFSLPGTFRVLYHHFPNARFILTERDSFEVWYKSLTRFHAKKFGNGKIPTREDLEQATYVYKGWAWQAHQAIYNTGEHNLYDEDILRNYYTNHAKEVRDFFKDKPGSLLIVNLTQPNALDEICNFLKVKQKPESLPWENRT